MEQVYTYETPSKLRRGFSFFIDQFIISFFLSITSLIIFSLVSDEFLLDFSLKSNRKWSWIYIFITSFCYFFYYFLSESINGTTFGKSLLRLYVFEPENMEKPSESKILIRSFTRFLPFEALFYLYSDDGIGPHDLTSGTVVKYRIKEKKAIVKKENIQIQIPKFKFGEQLKDINLGLLRLFAILAFLIPLFYTMYKYSDCPYYRDDCSWTSKFITFISSFVIYIITIVIGIWVYRGFKNSNKEQS
ncbi:MAG TPA: RDD family protein [Chitinophagales bacterium]|nr:RDD family protein [Chitinophagales bacterium]